MGLDMYACSTPKGADHNGDESIELHYWRKHHDLHGWMERKWVEKGGAGEFNCVALPLTSADLVELRVDVIGNRLPHTTGFFFGNNPPNEETIADDLCFIDKAEQAIRDGLDVYYNSWW